MQKKIYQLVLASAVGLSAISGFSQSAKQDLKEIAGGFVAPTAAETVPDGSGRLMVCDQVGSIYLIGADGKKSDQPFFDLTSKLVKLNAGFDERGLLGLAFHPEFAKNGKFYLTYTAPLRSSMPTHWNCTMNISEFTAEMTHSRASKVELASEKILLQIDKPYFNHNGGRLAFGPDGMLYISVGDGGNGNGTDSEGFKKSAESDKSGPPKYGHSPIGNGQDLNNLLGKILRINVNKGQPYSVPAENPIKAGQGRPEIYAWGLRNPWSMTFDRGGKNQMFVGDVGQNLYEEINIIEKGGNYGWNKREGFVCFDPKSANKPPENCPDVDADGNKFKEPIAAYKNKNRFRTDADAYGISVTGGYVYRGKALPHLDGKYVFADWSKNFAVASGAVLTASPDPDGKNWKIEPLQLKSFPDGALKECIPALGQDDKGELYILTSFSGQITTNKGKVYKLVPAE